MLSSRSREDLAQYTAPLTTDQLWATPFGLASAGFHIDHIAGSTDRLITYLVGRQLSPLQMAVLQNEGGPARPTREELLSTLGKVFEASESVVRSISPDMLAESRTVGRKHLPTTV